ncbi:MAG TPA: class I SAM-dependent methyltransferase [Chloroflexota bacterium]|nr:class I SAM-dependent methyltransferase [Chloroflexota bacterium]
MGTTMDYGDFPLAPPYSGYSTIYDSLCQSDFSQAFVPLVEQSIRRYGVSGKRLLDLACGTGTASIRLAALGFQVTGVDLSGEMLGIAGSKAAKAGVSVDFRRQDMSKLELEGTFDVVICLYDSLNHLLETEKLRSTFQGVARLLSRGGLFVFDFNTAYCLENDWGNRVEEERTETATLMHLYSFDPASRIGTLELICLSRHRGRVERFREIHHERGYTRGEVVEALGATGLLVVQEMAFPDLTPPREDSSRLIYVVRPSVECGA